MALFQRWRAERQLQRKSEQYVAALVGEPAEADVSWLASVATRGDVDHARWELRYARRAIGLVVAQRDALDDRTGSHVARAFAEGFERDVNIDRARRELAERQFNARLSAYRDALAARVADADARLGQTLLAFSGGSFREIDANVRRAGELLAGYEKEANEALRDIFGTATLPEHVPPSALAGGTAT
ncbi:MAG TPA: hypothetical protein VJ867_12650 [Gemmatimonadaceae bacterium]|nr:hypothetical protein [Gemmatimonadaceae bacterium]